MIEYTIISNILDKIRKMIKTPLKYPRNPTLLDPFKHLLKTRTWGSKWNFFWQNKWMGDMAMGKCEDWQRKSYIVQKNYKHSKGGYGRLPLGNVYTCHGFLLGMSKFEKTNYRTFFFKLFKGFGNPSEPPFNRIYGTQKMTLCNSR
jgi:hypothetical protein